MKKLSEEIVSFWKTSLSLGGMTSIEMSLLSKWIIQAQDLEDQLDQLLARIKEAEAHLQLQEDQLENDTY